MTTQTAGLAIPQARRFSSRQLQRWHAVSLNYVLLVFALIILLGFEFFPIFLVLTFGFTKASPMPTRF